MALTTENKAMCFDCGAEVSINAETCLQCSSAQPFNEEKILEETEQVMQYFLPHEAQANRLKDIFPYGMVCKYSSYFYKDKSIFDKMQELLEENIKKIISYFYISLLILPLICVGLFQININIGIGVTTIYSACLFYLMYLNIIPIQLAYGHNHIYGELKEKSKEVMFYRIKEISFLDMSYNIYIKQAYNVEKFKTMLNKVIENTNNATKIFNHKDKFDELNISNSANATLLSQTIISFIFGSGLIFYSDKVVESIILSLLGIIFIIFGFISANILTKATPVIYSYTHQIKKLSEKANSILEDIEKQENKSSKI